MTDLVKRLRDTPNWMREGFQDWKDNVRTYDSAPFEAADRIEELEAEVAKAREEGRRAGLEEVKLLLSARVADLILQMENAGLIDDYAQGLHDEAEGLLSEVAALAQTSTKEGE